MQSFASLRKYNQVGEARHLNVMIETKYKRKDMLVGEREKERRGREGKRELSHLPLRDAEYLWSGWDGPYLEQRAWKFFQAELKITLIIWGWTSSSISYNTESQPRCPVFLHNSAYPIHMNRRPFLKTFYFYFLCGPFLKSLLNLLQFCFCFLFWFFLAVRQVGS